MHSIQRILFLSVLVGCLFEQGYAQITSSRVDTLRREVTVVSDKVVRVPEASPLVRSYSYIQPRITRLEPLTPGLTGDFTPAVTIPEKPLLSRVAEALPSHQNGTFLRMSISPVISADAVGSWGSVGGSYDWGETGSLYFVGSYDARRSSHGGEGGELDTRRYTMFEGWASSNYSNCVVQYQKPVQSEGCLQLGFSGNYWNYDYVAGYKGVPYTDLEKYKYGVGGTYGYHWGINAGVENLKIGSDIALVSLKAYYNNFVTKGPIITANPALFKDLYKGMQHHTGVRFRGEMRQNDNISWLLSSWFNALLNRPRSMYARIQEVAAVGVPALRNNIFWEFAPQIKVQKEWDQVRFDASAGIGVSFLLAPFGKLYFYPKVDALLSLPYNWALYLTGTGGMEDVHPLHTLQQTYHTQTELLPNPSHTNLNLRLGARANLWDFVSVDFYMGGKHESNRGYFVAAKKPYSNYRKTLPQEQFYYTIGGYGALAQTLLGASVQGRVWGDLLVLNATLERRYQLKTSAPGAFPLMPDAQWYFRAGASSKWNRFSLHSSFVVANAWQIMGTRGEVLNNRSVDFASSLQYQIKKRFAMFLFADYRNLDNLYFSQFSPWYFGLGFQLNL